MGKTPTIRDVAASAGVSIASVSRVINGLGVTSSEVEEAVRKAIQATGFRLNVLGRRLKTARTHTLGVLVPSLKNPIFTDALQGIERAAEAAGYSLLLTSSSYAPAKEKAAVDLLLANRVEGLVLTVAQEARSPTIRLLVREGLPFVLVFNPPLRRSISTVAIDDRRAARDLVERLIALGHRKIVMVAGTFEASDRSGLRRKGFEDALSAHGLVPAGVYEVGFEQVDLDGLCAVIVGGASPPTALFCSTDMLAIAAMRAMQKLGLAVPGDISVAGFDGIELGEWTSPSLTTIVQPAEQMGAAATRHLLARIAGNCGVDHLLLDHGMRLGDSCGPPPSARSKVARLGVAKVLGSSDTRSAKPIPKHRARHRAV